MVLRMIHVRDDVLTVWEIPGAPWKIIIRKNQFVDLLHRFLAIGGLLHCCAEKDNRALQPVAPSPKRVSRPISNRYKLQSPTSPGSPQQTNYSSSHPAPQYLDGVGKKTLAMGSTYEISDSDSGEREDEERQIAEAIRLSLLESPRPHAQGESSSSGGPQRGSKKRKMDVIEIVSDDEGDDGILDGINATRKAPKASNNSSVRTRAVGILGVTGPAIVSKPADGLLRTIGNRAQIERERLARLAELKRSPPDFGLLSNGAAPKSPKPEEAGPSRFSGGGFTLSGALAFEPSRFSTDNRKQVHTHDGRRLGDSSDSSDTTSGFLQYPDGIVKKTWADGYPKTDSEITFEEVLQKVCCLLVL